MPIWPKHLSGLRPGLGRRASPALLLLGVWAAAVLSYLFGPVRYHDEVRTETWLFIISGIAAFLIGNAVGRWPAVKLFHVPLPLAYDRRVSAAIVLLACIGIAGAAALIVERLSFSGIDYDAGFTAARFARADEVNAALADTVQRTPLLYIGYLLFPLAVPAYLIYVLAGERISGLAALLAHLALLSPAAYAVVYGGRSPLGVLFGLVASATLVRWLLRKPLLPGRWIAKAAIGIGVVGMVVYSGYIFSQRRQLSNLDDSFVALEDRFETIYAATIAPPIGEAVATGVVPESTAVNLAMTYFYFTHEISMLDRTLRAERFGPYLGQYQFYLPAVAVWRMFPRLSSQQRIIAEAQTANTYGWFSSALGSMYLDFGWWGALVMIGFCGWLSQQVFRRVIRQNSLAAQLALCYVYCGIIASPVLSIFTISVSTLFLAAIGVAMYLVRRPPSPSLSPDPCGY